VDDVRLNASSRPRLENDTRKESAFSASASVAIAVAAAVIKATHNTCSTAAANAKVAMRTCEPRSHEVPLAMLDRATAVTGHPHPVLAVSSHPRLASLCCPRQSRWPPAGRWAGTVLAPVKATQHSEECCGSSQEPRSQNHKPTVSAALTGVNAHGVASANFLYRQAQKSPAG
jgi:hypothetical protein